MDELNFDKNNYVSRLGLPGEQFDALAECGTSPEALRDYLERLPHSNAAELCNRLYRLLPQIAGLRLPPGKKISLLDIAKPEAMDCVRRLTHNLAITPSSAKNLSIAIALLKHLAAGYKSVIDATVRSPAAPPHVLMEACHAAIGVLREILMDCWECYVTPPANTWLEIHAVYQIAKGRGIDRATVHRRVRGQPLDNTIHSSYVIPLMMDCADPGRYTPPDLRQIEQFLQTTAQLVEFDSPETEGIFVIDPDTDKGPQYSFKINQSSPRQFRLKSYRLVRSIEENLATGSLSGLSERVARELCRYWSTEIQRSDHPQPDNTGINLVIGLNHVHRYITGTKSLRDFVARTGQVGTEGLRLLELAEDDGPGYRDTFLKKKSPADAFTHRRPAPGDNLDPSTPVSALRHYSAVRTNRSEHGGRVEFNAPAETLTAGEVVLIEPREGEHWQIALVRWTRVTRKRDRMLGVEILADAATPCAVRRSKTANGNDDQYFAGLIFEHGGGRRIILPTLPFSAFSRVNIITGAIRTEINLKECVEETFHISVFNIDHNGPV